MPRKKFQGIGIIDVRMEGADKMLRKLDKIKDRAIRRDVRRGVSKVLTPVASAMRKAAPVGATKNLKKSIGKKVGKNKRTGETEAKVGANVGKKGPRKAPHTHLIILGTKPRKRKRIGGKFALYDRNADNKSTGKVEKNDFILREFNKHREAVIRGIGQEVAKGLKRAN